MNKLFILLVLTFSFVCTGQINKKQDYTYIDIKDIVEIKDLIYFKADTVLVTGRIVQYNNKNKPKKYIWVKKGIADNFGWQPINEERIIQTEESALGSLLLGVGQVLDVTNTINIPNSRTSHSSDPNIDNYRKYNKQFIKKEVKNLSDRNRIYNNLTTNDFSNFKTEAKDGLVTEFYDNKQLKSKGNYIKGKKQGTWEEYYSNGNLMSRKNFIEGNEEGLWVEHYNNGQLKKKGNYVEFKKEGIWETYNKNDELESKISYLNGKKTGVMEVYHLDGSLKVHLNYIDGKENGLMKVYHKNGQLILKGFFKEGKEIGEWKTYSDTGKLIKTENFD